MQLNAAPEKDNRWESLRIMAAEMRCADYEHDDSPKCFVRSPTTPLSLPLISRGNGAICGAK